MTALDLDGLERLYRAAFPAEDLVPLVRALSENGAVALGLVAESDEGILGHAAFTRCAIEPGGGSAYLLGPVAVKPALQRSGIGSELIREGLSRLPADAQVQVLGDPVYYGRFGFAADGDIEPPHALPKAWLPAWQSRAPADGRPKLKGRLIVPAPWQDPALWR